MGCRLAADLWWRSACAQAMQRSPPDDTSMFWPTGPTLRGRTLACQSDVLASETVVFQSLHILCAGLSGWWTRRAKQRLRNGLTASAARCQSGTTQGTDNASAH